MLYVLHQIVLLSISQHTNKMVMVNADLLILLHSLPKSLKTVAQIYRIWVDPCRLRWLSNMYHYLPGMTVFILQGSFLWYLHSLPDDEEHRRQCFLRDIHSDWLVYFSPTSDMLWSMFFNLMYFVLDSSKMIDHFTGCLGSLTGYFSNSGGFSLLIAGRDLCYGKGWGPLRHGHEEGFIFF